MSISIELTRNDLNIRPWMLEEGGALDLDECPNCWEKTAHIERYMFALSCVGKYNKIIDFGCGVGFGSELLYRGENGVVGLDTSVAALKLARSRRPYISFVDNMVDFSDFSVCTCLEVIEHLNSPEVFIDSLNVKQLVASVPVIPTTDLNEHHKHNFTVKTFKQLLDRKYYVIDSLVQTLPAHINPSVLTCFCIQK